MKGGSPAEQAAFFLDPHARIHVLWSGAAISLEQHHELHARWRNELHRFGHFSVTPLNASPERARAAGTVYWQAEIPGRPPPNVIKAVVGEDWVLERTPAGGLAFVLYVNTFHHFLADFRARLPMLADGDGAPYISGMSRKASFRRGGSAVLGALGAFILLLALPAGAQAQPLEAGGQLAEHNGSIMRVLTDDRAGRLTIVYEIPRPGLAAFGVIPGTVLIDGRWTGRGRFEGIAHVFGCGRAYPYRVTGFIGEGDALFLEGPAPVLTPWCAVAAYVWNENARLTFWPQTELPPTAYAPPPPRLLWPPR